MESFSLNKETTLYCERRLIRMKITTNTITITNISIYNCRGVMCILVGHIYTLDLS